MTPTNEFRSSRDRRTDFAVLGGGIIGICVARHLRRRHAADVTVFEKEPSCGQHASSRNSGVLHEGFYYTADSLKAQFTRDGNAAPRAYCEERGPPLNRCGKLVVARTATADPQAVLAAVTTRSKPRRADLDVRHPVRGPRGRRNRVAAAVKSGAEIFGKPGTMGSTRRHQAPRSDAADGTTHAKNGF
jgi:glycine/D-amino acid oxidase-like deaminating enzyme